jgi:hypothetical protein
MMEGEVQYVEEAQQLREQSRHRTVKNVKKDDDMPPISGKKEDEATCMSPFKAVYNCLVPTRNSSSEEETSTGKGSNTYNQYSPLSDPHDEEDDFTGLERDPPLEVQADAIAEQPSMLASQSESPANVDSNEDEVFSDAEEDEFSDVEEIPAKKEDFWARNLHVHEAEDQALIEEIGNPTQPSTNKRKEKQDFPAAGTK